MSVMSRMFGEVKAAVSGDVAAFDAMHTQQPTKMPQRQTDNPMQKVLDSLSGTQASGCLNLDMILDKADVMYPDMPAYDRANLSGCDVQGVTITQTGIDRLRDMSGDSDLCLNLRDSNIGGCVFKPASTFAGVLIDQTTISRSTDATNVTFDGLSDHQTELSLSKGNWSGFAIKGAGDATPATQVNLSVEEGAMACGGDIAGSRYTRLASTNADMSGLKAASARGMAIDVVGGRLNGSDFSNCSVAPGSRISADCIGVNFENGVLGDCSLAGSRLTGVNLKGVDLTNVNVDNVSARPEDFIGASYKVHGADGELKNSIEITGENVGDFLKYKMAQGQTVNIQGPDTVVRTQVGNKSIQGAGVVDAVKQEVATIHQAGERMTPAKQSTQTAQTVSMNQTDGLINALVQVNSELAKGGITRNVGYDETNIGAQHQSATHQRDHDLSIERGTERV